MTDKKVIPFTQIKRINKVVDQLEQRTATLEVDKLKLKQKIATLEKVLESHAKTIGEIRDKDDLKDMPEEVLVKTWKEK